MIRTPEWQDPLFNASIGIATLLDEIDNELGDDEGKNLYEHATTVQRYITRLEGILYKEKTHGI
tara:strand:+ start:106 stop:297 length:192 start_codon:yes stop_codon:yes gene_type:complete